MPAHPKNPAVFGPFDGDFDPFDDDDEFGVLITFGRQKSKAIRVPRAWITPSPSPPV
jgi:hypothetical protein